MNEQQFAFDSDVVTSDDVGVRAPRRFSVIFHNDNYTTMEFVVMILMTVFGHTEERAMLLMRTIHEKGSAAVGVWSREIAETRAVRAMDMARREGFPLRCTLKEV